MFPLPRLKITSGGFMKTWTVKTNVGPDRIVSFTVPEDIPLGPIEIVVVTQSRYSNEELKRNKDQNGETPSKEKVTDEGWVTHGIEVYKSL
jgi:hypothetical protein